MVLIERYLFQNLSWLYMIFKIFLSPYQVVDLVELHLLLRLVWYLLPDPGVPTSLPNWYAPDLRTGGTGDQSPQLV